MTSADELKARTKRFAVEVLKLARTLPADPIARDIALQLVRSATSVAANYRASCRGRSNAEFIAKMGVVEEEADESALWLEILDEDGAAPRERIRPLLDEADQLIRIVVASVKTARRNSSERRLCGRGLD